MRPLTQRPYVNGPDGFGSGQPDGMLAGMADGSVRFLSKNIDPHVMEQLAMVHGDKDLDVTSIGPLPEGQFIKPAVAPANPPVADAKPPVAEVTPEVVDVKPDPKLQALLDMPIAKFSLPNIPLAKAVQVISEIGNLPVSFDPDAMEELGVSLHDPVSIALPTTTVGKVLEAIAAERNMTPVFEDGQTMLTSTADHRQSLRTIPYDVADLTGGDARAAKDLAALVQRLVVPESWQTHGGRGTVDVSPDLLRITQTGRVHYQIIVFCDKLRLARGLPPKSRLDPKKLVLATRSLQAKAILDHPVSMSVVAPLPLWSILDQFKQPAGTEILIDRPALAAIGLSENTGVKLKADKLPQGEALEKLLEPLGLSWRVVDSSTLQVTAQKTVVSRMELEFYPVGKLLAGQTVEAWIARVKTWLPAAAWGAAGGDMYFDPSSKYLIVLQSQPMQRTLEGLLTK